MKNYASYKESDVEWLGKIPTNWKTGHLGFFSKTYRGSGYQYLDKVDEDSSVKKMQVVRISDMNSFDPIWVKHLDILTNS